MSTSHAHAQALRNAGKTAEAIDAYKALTAMHPADRIAWHNLASIFGDTGQHGEAVEACKKAQRLGLDAAETWLVLARSLQALAHLDEAQHAFEAALDRKPLDLTTHRDYAQLIWMRSGDADRALDRFEATLKANPGNLSLLLGLARVLGQMGLKDKGLARAREAARLAPEIDIVQISAANAANLASAFEEASDFARCALALSPQNTSAGLALAQALFGLGDVEQAADLLPTLRSLSPNDQYVIAMQTTAWRLLGDPRYLDACDYTRLVRSYSLTPPQGWASVESYVDDLEAALHERHAFNAHPFDQSVKGAGSQITHVEQIKASPPLAAWPEATLPAIRAYLGDTCLCPELEREGDAALVARYETWSIKLRQSGFHTDHVHPSGIISSACHIAAPTDMGEPPNGWLRFGHPGIQTKPALGAEYFQRPDPGVIVCFPSYLWHGVTPFTGDEPRLTIAMDIAQR